MKSFTDPEVVAVLNGLGAARPGGRARRFLKAAITAIFIFYTLFGVYGLVHSVGVWWSGDPWRRSDAPFDFAWSDVSLIFVFGWLVDRVHRYFYIWGMLRIMLETALLLLTFLS